MAAAVAPGLICGWLLFGPQWLAVTPPTCRGHLSGMTPPITLSIYIARQFAGAVVGMLLALSGLVALFDFIELLRRSDRKPDATFSLVAEIAALRLPYIAMQMLPFAVLLGGILCFWRLTRSSELIVARAAGVSAWEFLTAPTLCALLFGMLATCAVSPLSSVMFGRAEAMDNAYLKSGGGPLALTGGQLWLRQSDRALVAAGRRDHPCARRGAARQAADRVAGQRVPSGWPRPAARPDRGERGDARRRRLAVAERARHPAGADAGAAGHDQPADRPDRGARAGELRLARYAVVLGAARLHRAARPLGLLLDPPPAAFPGAARPAAALPRPWRWSPPDSPCVRRDAAAWRR